MDAIFQALPGIILRALPTFFLVILLHWFLKIVLVRPLEQTLEERRSRTSGAVESTHTLLAGASGKLTEYERSLGSARAEIFKEQEGHRKRLTDQQSAALTAAREAASGRVSKAREELQAEAESVRASLAAESDRLADVIAGSLLARNPQ